MLAVTAYIVRGLQLLLGSSKRAMTERAEEMGAEDDAIPLTQSSGVRQDSVNPSTTTTASLSLAEDDLMVPQTVQDPSRVRSTGGPPENDVASPISPRLREILQAPLPLTRPQRWTAFINSNVDRICYSILFLFVGLPVYYTTGYAMPAQLTFNVLAYFAALSLPPQWKQFLHPVLVSSGVTILGIWIFGFIRGDTLHDVLDAYKTGSSYLLLWNENRQFPAPGAGDIFGSVLDGTSYLALYTKTLQEPSSWNMF